MTNIGSFNLNGEKLKFSLHFDVYRVSNIIVIEFFNNGILPIQLEHVTKGYKLSILGHELFKEPVSEDAVFDIQLETAPYAAGTEIILLSNSPVQLTSIQVKTFGELSFRPNSDVKIEFGDIQLWCRRNDITMPVGLTNSGVQIVMTYGFSYSSTQRYILFGFPNGMKFPVFREQYGLKIVESDLIFDNSIRCVALKLRQMTPDFVRFRLLFFLGDTDYHIMCCDDIKYGRETIEYGGVSLKTAQLTKRLFLRG